MKFWNDFLVSYSESVENNEEVNRFFHRVSQLFARTNPETINQYQLCELTEMLVGLEDEFSILRSLWFEEKGFMMHRVEGVVVRAFGIIRNRLDGKWQCDVLMYLEGLRKSKKMTKKALAIKADVSHSYVSRLTLSKRNGITLEVFRRLCEALDTNVIAVLSYVK